MKRLFSIEVMKGTREFMIAIPSPSGEHDDYNFYIDISEGRLSNFQRVTFRTCLTDEDTINGGDSVEHDISDGQNWIASTHYPIDELGIVRIEVNFGRISNIVDVFLE